MNIQSSTGVPKPKALLAALLAQLFPNLNAASSVFKTGKMLTAFVRRILFH